MSNIVEKKTLFIMLALDGAIAFMLGVGVGMLW
jgi:hypothetical protein